MIPSKETHIIQFQVNTKTNTEILNKKRHNIQSKTYILYTNPNLGCEINCNHNSIQQTHNCNFKTHFHN